jgi:hypothetical protein
MPASVAWLISGHNVVELHAETDVVGLLTGALGPLLEVVAGAAVLHEGDFYGAFVEGRRLLSRGGTFSRASRILGNLVAVPGAGKNEKGGAQPYGWKRLAPHAILLSAGSQFRSVSVQRGE